MTFLAHSSPRQKFTNELPAIMCIECIRALESCDECLAICVVYRDAVSALGDVNKRARYRSDDLSWLEEAKQTVQLARAEFRVLNTRRAFIKHLVAKHSCRRGHLRDRDGFTSRARTKKVSDRGAI